MRERKLFRDRDENGWRVPLAGTLSRKIYDLLKDGVGPADIARKLRVNVKNVNILIHRFRNPDWRPGRDVNA